MLARNPSIQRRLVGSIVVAVLVGPLVIALSPMWYLGVRFRTEDVVPLLGYLLRSFGITVVVVALSVTAATMALRLRYRSGLKPSIMDFVLLVPLVLGEVVFGASIKISGFVVELPSIDMLPPMAVQLVVITIYYTVICSRGALLFALLHARTEYYAVLDYARTCGLDANEFIRELAPSIKTNLFVSASILALLLCVSAHAITAIGFRTGPGYGIEVWPQYLARTVTELGAGSPTDAERFRTLAYVLVTVTTLCFAAGLVALQSMFQRLQDFALGKSSDRACIGAETAMFSLAVAIITYLLAMSLLAIVAGHDIREIDPSVRLKLLLSFVACLFLAVVVVFAARLASSFMDNGVPRLRAAAGLLAGICIILPLHGLASGTNVLSLKAGATGHAESIGAWLAANFLFLFPIAFGFSLFLEGAEPRGKTAYLVQNEIRTMEDFRLFVVPRERETILLFAILIAFFAWCALPVSSMFDHSVQTLATAVFSLTESRGASLQDAAVVIATSLVLVSIVLGLFSRYLSQISRSR